MGGGQDLANDVEHCVAVVGESGVGDCQAGDVIRGERDSAESFRPLTDEARNPDIEPVCANGLNLHRFAEQGSGQDLPFADGYFNSQRRDSGTQSLLYPGSTELVFVPHDNGSQKTQR